MKPSRVKAVILDWAGTTVDFGCQAPVRVLREIFDAARVSITSEEARENMGLAKRDHIWTILSNPRVAALVISFREIGLAKSTSGTTPGGAVITSSDANASSSPIST